MDFSNFEISEYTKALQCLQFTGNRLERCSEDVLDVLGANSPDLCRQIKALREQRQRVVDAAAEKTRRESDDARRVADVTERLRQAEIQIAAQRQTIERAAKGTSSGLDELEARVTRAGQYRTRDMTP
jgi:small-conductance mechanosensitive channel